MFVRSRCSVGPTQSGLAALCQERARPCWHICLTCREYFTGFFGCFAAFGRRSDWCFSLFFLITEADLPGTIGLSDPLRLHQGEPIETVRWDHASLLSRLLQRLHDFRSQVCGVSQTALWQRRATCSAADDKIIVRSARHGVNAQIPAVKKLLCRVLRTEGKCQQSVRPLFFSLAARAQRRLNPGLRSFRHPSTQLREYLHDGFGRAPSQAR